MTTIAVEMVAILMTRLADVTPIADRVDAGMWANRAGSLAREMGSSARASAPLGD